MSAEGTNVKVDEEVEQPHLPPPPLPSPPPPEFSLPSSSAARGEAREKGEEGEITLASTDVRKSSGEVSTRPQAPPLPYDEPEWSGPPEHDYYFEVLKNGTIIDRVSVDSKPFYVVGRLPIVDLPQEHPSVSRYHCIVQFRKADLGGGVFVYDLGSTHGTRWNKKRLAARKYVRLRQGQMIRFGESSRMYILGGGPTYDPDEEERERREAAERRDRLQKAEDKVEGMEDGDDDTGDGDGGEPGTETGAKETEVFSGSLSEVKQFLAKRQRGVSVGDAKRLRDRIREEAGVEERVRGNSSREEMLMTSGKRSLSSARNGSLDEYEDDEALLRRGATDLAEEDGEERIEYDWDELDSDSDDDFFDRTMTEDQIRRHKKRKKLGLKKKNKKKKHNNLMKKKKSKKVEEVVVSAESLRDELDQLRSRDFELEESIETLELRIEKISNRVGNAGDGDMDAILGNMVSKEQATKKRALERERKKLSVEIERVEKLFKIATSGSGASVFDHARPGGSRQKTPFLSKSSLPKRSSANDSGVPSPSSTDISRVERSEVDRARARELLAELAPSRPSDNRDTNGDIGDETNGDMVKQMDTEKGEQTETTTVTSTATVTKTDEKKKKKSKPVGGIAATIAALGREIAGEDDDSPDQSRRKRARRRNKNGGDASTAQPKRPRLDFEDEQRYSEWVPPANQSGDGRTSLNSKLGY